MALHHGGIFYKEEYIEGKLNYVDECSVLRFDLFELASRDVNRASPPGFGPALLGLRVNRVRANRVVNSFGL